MDYYAYGEGFYAFEDGYAEQLQTEPAESQSKIFKSEEDKQRYLLMLAGYIKPEQKKTEKDKYDDMLSPR